MEIEIILGFLGGAVIIGLFLHFGGTKKSSDTSQDDLMAMELTKKIDTLNQNMTQNLNTVTKMEK